MRRIQRDCEDQRPRHQADEGRKDLVAEDREGQHHSCPDQDVHQPLGQSRLGGAVGRESRTHGWAPRCAQALELPSLRYNPDDHFLGDEHHDDDDDERQQAVEPAFETNLVAEGEAERLQDHELRQEQDDPGEEVPAKGHQAAGLRLEVSRDPVLDRDRHLQENLEQDGRQQRCGEGVDGDLARILDEEIQDQQVDQHGGEVPDEQSLTVGRSLCRCRQERFCFHRFGLPEYSMRFIVRPHPSLRPLDRQPGVDPHLHALPPAREPCSIGRASRLSSIEPGPEAGPSPAATSWPRPVPR